MSMPMPTDEDVENVVMFTGFTDRNLIIAGLQASNNNVEKVVNEILDDRTKYISQYGWDDSAFGANREGTPNSQVPSFAIHAADDNVIQGVNPAYYAPSRPPSRTNDRSPLSKLVDYTADGAAGVQLPVMTAQEREDAELRQAIAASVATSNIHSPQAQPQETGVAEGDASQPYFGPANRSDYSHNEWAMVTMNKTKSEPEPAGRKREPGVPAFLRNTGENTWQKHRLGAIVTIFHAIPTARNALLRAGEPPANGYGHDPEWWKGKPIVQPVQAVQDAGGDFSWTSEPRPVWSEELQRVMAFLDATERSYGNADMLATTQPEGSYSRGNPEKDFYDYMTCGEGGLENFRSLMVTTKAARIKDLDDAGTQTLIQNWGLLELMYSKEQLLAADNLYNLFDEIFFSDVMGGVDDEEEARTALIMEPAEVMSFRFDLGNDGLPKKLDIPRVLYIDRYLASRKEQVLQIQHGIHDINKRLALAEQLERKATRITDPETGEEHDGVALATAAIARMKVKIGAIRLNAQWRMHLAKGEETGREPDYLPNIDIEDNSLAIDYTEEETDNIKWYWSRIRQLERDLAKVQKRVETINNHRNRLQMMRKQLSTVLTGPSEKDGLNANHSYTLRGVASSFDTFYICIRAEADLMELDDPDSNVEPKEQWWKLGYVADDDNPIKTEMTTYEKAIEEACGIGSKPFLVYATEKALAEDPVPLTDALETFVRFDNKLFTQELSKPSTQDNDKKRGAYATPTSPAKRRNRSNSWDSVATNAASAGSLDELHEDFLNSNDDAVFSQDMPDLVDTAIPDMFSPPARVTSPEYIDGQRSPKPTEPPPSPEPATSTRQVANFSLDEIISRGLAERGQRPQIPPRPVKSWSQAAHQPSAPPAVEHYEYGVENGTKSPEMQERSGTTSPFFNQSNKPPVNGEVVSVTALDTMDIDDPTHGSDNHGVPPAGVSNPEPKV